VKHLLRTPHLWAILIIMACGAALYYADRIPALREVVSDTPFWLARYSTHRILSIIPVAYAAFVFGLRGGMIASFAVAIGLLPRALLISTQKPEAVAETVAFLLMGLLVSWLIDRQQQAVRSLERSRREVIASLAMVRSQQEQLQASEERYRTLFENAGEAVAVCSPDGGVVSANKACELLTGYDRDSLIGTSIYRLFPEEDTEVVRAILSEGLEGRTVAGREGLRLTGKDGTEAIVRLAVSPLAHGDQIAGLQIIALDVTDEVRLRRNMEYYITQVTRAQEDERLRVSRELHDETAQELVVLSRDIATLLEEDDNIPRRLAERLQKLRETADSALEGVRRFSRDLRPSILDDLGLVPALEWLLESLERQYPIATSISITGSQARLAPEKELIIFRIAQEALANVRRHADATAVDVSVDIDESGLTLLVTDNGRGFVMPERAGDLAQLGKLGIVGMRERARLVGGTLIVQSEPGRGTTVSLHVPR